MRRFLRALERRAESGELEALEQLADLIGETAQAYRRGLRLAHDGPARYSYGELAAWVGISRQGARQLAGRAKPRTAPPVE